MTPQKAIQVLNITKQSLNEKTTLRHFYARALLKAHPDHGGTTEATMSVVQAYKELIYFIKTNPSLLKTSKNNITH